MVKIRNNIKKSIIFEHSNPILKDLERSEKKYRNLVENSSDFIYTINEKGIITYISSNIERLGYDSKQVIGKNIAEFIHPEDVNIVINDFKFTATTNKKKITEFRLRKKNGDYIFCEETGEPILNNGKFQGINGIIRDVTIKKQAEEDLKLEKDNAKRYLDIAGVMLCVLDSSGNIKIINKKGCEILGYDQDKIVGKNWFKNFLPKRLRKEVYGVFQKLISGEIKLVEYYENPILTKNKIEKDIAFHNTVIKDKNGKISSIMFSGEDITEQKKSQSELKRSNDFNKHLLNTIPFPMDIVDEKGKILFMNPVLKKIFGEKSIGKRCWGLYKDDKRQCTDCPLKKGIKIGETASITTSSVLGGKIFRISHTGMMFEGKKAILEIFEDITEIAKAEKEIEDLAKFPSENPNPVLRINSKGIILYANQAANILSDDKFGISVGKKAPKIWLKSISEIFKTKKKIDNEYSIGGKTFTFTITPVKGTDYINIYAKDITEQNKKEKQIFESKQMLENITQGIPDGIMLLTPDLKIIWANEALRKQTGLKIDQIIGNHCYCVTHNRKTPCQPPHDICPIKELYSTGKPISVEHTHTDSKGDKKFVDVTAFPIKDEKGNITQIVHFAHDVTERKNMEQSLYDNKKAFDKILENSNDIIIEVDLEGNLIYSNKKMKQLLGYDDENLSKISLFEITDKKFHKYVKTLLNNVNHEQYFNEILMNFKSKSGKIISVEGNIMPKIINKKVVGSMGFFRDVTQRKVYEDEINQRSGELEKFNKLAIGRELKMIELKKKIEELQKRIGERNAK